VTGFILTRVMRDGTKRYDACWRANNRQRSRTFHRRKDAERYLATVVKAVHEGAYQEVRPIPMGELFDQWLSRSLEVRVKQGLLKPSTSKSYRSMVEAHLRPAFGEYRSDRLTHAGVGDWAARMADQIAEGDCSPKFYNNLLNLFHAILAWARHPAQGYLAHDPLLGQRRLPRPRTEREFLEPSEVEVLLKAAEPPDDTIVRLDVYTGLRRGELFALQWPDVDWGAGGEGGRLWVRRSIYQGAVTSPKTAHSERVVDVPQPILDDLAVYREMWPPKDPGYVFRTATGKPLDPDNWYKRRFLPTLERAGLRRVGVHALRHTYASLLINQGESIKYVSRQLGHASIQITADLYGHLFRETSVAAMRRLGDAIPSSKRPAEPAEGRGKTTEQGGAPRDQE
jgi:integrase